eukprot:TRINITY_DN435_c0_g1_i2.p1 TRINITY_DN435_c0_g1~~TRINITY_DN435_c0_g1_i2.p1  ORF type:complete len:198 (-),score=36.60 TRINITY_DN435_c0_g1_i2:248-841(-)
MTGTADAESSQQQTAGQQGYHFAGQPQQGYPYAQGYPPPQGYAFPQGYNAPPQGYNAPPQGYIAAPQGYIAAPYGYAPTNPDPTNPNYNPQYVTYVGVPAASTYPDGLPPGQQYQPVIYAEPVVGHARHTNDNFQSPRDNHFYPMFLWIFGCLFFPLLWCGGAYWLDSQNPVARGWARFNVISLAILAIAIIIIAAT